MTHYKVTIGYGDHAAPEHFEGDDIEVSTTTGGDKRISVHDDGDIVGEVIAYNEPITWKEVDR